MAGGLWHKTLVYFGLADEDDEYDDELMSVRPEDEPSYREAYRERPKVRRMERDPRRRQVSDFDDIFSEEDYREERAAPFTQQRSGGLRALPAGTSPGFCREVPGTGRPTAVRTC